MTNSHVSSQRPACWGSIAGILCLFHIISAWHVLLLPDSIRSVIGFPVAAQAGLALVWAGLWGVAAFRLVRGRANALGYTYWLASGFIVYRLLRYVLVAQPDAAQSRFPFLLLLTISFLAVPIIMRFRRLADRDRNAHN